MEIQGLDIPSTGFDRLDRMIAEKAPRVGDDQLTWDWFIDDHETDRYTFDFGLSLGPDGDPAAWHQFDTSSDAPYFGYWLQRRDRMILNWAEGDLSLRHFMTPEAYDAALLRLCRCYAPVPAFSTYDPEEGQWTDHFEDRSPLFYNPSKLDSIDDDE